MWKKRRSKLLANVTRHFLINFIQGDTEPAGNDVSPESEPTPGSKLHFQVNTYIYLNTCRNLAP